jgi:hypothetical protein
LPQPAASPEKTHLGLGMAINPDRLKEALGRINLARPAIAPYRLLRLLDRPDDIPVMAPLIEQEILYRLLAGPCGPRLLQIATTQTQQDRSGHRLASGELQAASAHRGPSRTCRHERLLAASALQGRHSHDADALSKAASAP